MFGLIGAAWLWSLQPAGAHGFPTRTAWALDAAMEARAEGLRVVVQVEVPVVEATSRLWARFGVGSGNEETLAAFTAEMLDVFAQELSVEVDGLAPGQVWLPVEHERNGKGRGGFVVYWLETDIPWPAWAGDEVEVRLVDDVGLHAEVYVTRAASAVDGWRVLDVADPEARGECGVDGADHPAAWVEAELRRRWSVRFAR